MKKVICEKYGPPSVMRIIETNKPSPKADEVLVKVMATAVNSGDIRVRSLNIPWYAGIIMRIIFGFTKPKNPLGTVLSGVVEKVGGNVRSFKLGDHVYAHTGMKMGAYAEYITLAEKSAIAPKPKKASFEEAAAIPFGGVTALYFLQRGGIEQRKGQKVIIYGSSGAVGSAAVQLAKYYGAEVTAICGKDSTKLAKLLGADHIIVYTNADFTKNGKKYGIIFDAVGKKPKKECSDSLSPSGRYISVNSSTTAKEQKEQLELLSKLYDNNKYHAIIDKVYPLKEIVNAHKYVALGTKKGNVIVSVGSTLK